MSGVQTFCIRGQKCKIGSFNKIKKFKWSFLLLFHPHKKKTQHLINKQNSVISGENESVNDGRFET